VNSSHFVAVHQLKVQDLKSGDSSKCEDYGLLRVLWMEAAGSSEM
jgi:hypothetical protein